MSKKLRWGVCGTGNIAHQFAAGVKSAHRSTLSAVGSRSQDSADDFARDFEIANAHGSYDALLGDDSIDAIYLSLPNHLHHEWTIKSLEAGKHVLCEKPIAVDAKQATEMFDAAERCDRVLVEAFMYRAHPQTHALLRHVADGAIGEVKLIRTAFCFRVRNTEGNIRFDRSMAGGALMDVGCYCVSFSRLLAQGPPTAVHAVAAMHESGVDEQTSAVLGFENGVTATFTCGMGVQTNNTALVCGDEGYIEIEWPWKPQPGRSGFTICRAIPPRQDGNKASTAPPRQRVDVPVEGELYGIEADAFAACVLDGAEPFVTREETLANMRTLDEIRRQIGLAFG